MNYEFVQAALTAAINVTAIAGLTGIIAHAFWTSHYNWMTEHCPPVAPYTEEQPKPELLPDETETIVPTLPPLSSPNPQPQPEEDPWFLEIDEQIHQVATKLTPVVKPILMLPPSKPQQQQEPTFNGYSLSRLKKIAKEMKIKRYSVMQPHQLMVAISTHPKAKQLLG